MARQPRIKYTEELKAEIWHKYKQGESLWSIARSLNRSSSSIYRQLARNRALGDIVENKLGLHWSPEQITGWLKKTYSSNENHQVSHETIYRSLFVQAVAP